MGKKESKPVERIPARQRRELTWAKCMSCLSIGALVGILIWLLFFTSGCVATSNDLAELDSRIQTRIGTVGEEVNDLIGRIAAAGIEEPPDSPEGWAALMQSKVDEKLSEWQEISRQEIAGKIDEINERAQQGLTAVEGGGMAAIITTLGGAALHMYRNRTRRKDIHNASNGGT
jgi:hypothetical protein